MSDKEKIYKAESKNRFGGMIVNYFTDNHLFAIASTHSVIESVVCGLD